MNRKIALLTMSLAFVGHAAFSLTTNEVVSDLQGQGYTRVEVKVGPTQMKVEAIRGSEKLEIIYDTVSGRVLKSETEQVGAGENTAPGVSVRERGEDFVEVRSSSDDDGSDDGADDNGGVGHDEDGSEGSDDSGSDDDGSDDHGGDDHGGDDSDSDDDESDDSDNDDNGGDDSGNDDSGSDD